MVATHDPVFQRAVRLQGRVLFLADDAALLREQLAGRDLGGLEGASLGGLKGASLRGLRDDISTDEIVPAQACYHCDERLGDFVYTGLRCGGEFPVGRGAVRRGGFVVSVSGRRRGKGSSREAAPYAERAAGIRLVIAESFERIYRENCEHLGIFTSTDFGLIDLVLRGESIPLERLMEDAGPIGRQVIEQGGLLALGRARLAGRVRMPVPATPPRAMTLAEKILARHWVRDPGAGSAGGAGAAGAASAAGAVGVPAVRPGDEGFVRADLRFSHEYVTPMAAELWRESVGGEFPIRDPGSVLLFRDHLTLLELAPPSPDAGEDLLELALALKERQEAFAREHGLTLYGELSLQGAGMLPQGVAGTPLYRAPTGGPHPDPGESPRGDTAEALRHVRGSEGICHAIVLERHALPGQVIVGSDSHTPHAGAIGCVAFGVGTTAICGSWLTGDVRLRVPPSVLIRISGRLAPNVSAKDLMLELLRHPFVRAGRAAGRIVEYCGDAIAQLSLDERATLTNMAAEVGAFTGIIAPDGVVADFLVTARGMRRDDAAALVSALQSDPGAEYEAVLELDASAVPPMVARPGDPGNGIPLAELPGPVKIDIAYAGSCTAGKREDMDMYARVFAEAAARGARVADGVRCYVQFGSQDVKRYAERRGYLELFRAVGAEVLEPSCGACINAGPGVSRSADTVTVSAINRNFPGRSGPGQVYLASPYTVAASAIAGWLVAWDAPA